MALPQQTHTSYNQHGGQILFQPTGGDGHLYLIVGHGGDDGSSEDDVRSFYGKIIRLDVDRRSTPTMERPETLAMGPRNPMGCSFDSENPSDLYCKNVDQRMDEQVYLFTTHKAGSYSGASATATPVISHGRPGAGRAPSIVGGLVYHGSADPWLKGRYLYMYGSAAWAAVVTPDKRGGRYAASARVPNVRCSGSSPVPCPGGGIVVSGSWGEDNSKDSFLLATGGVYRLVEPGRCGGGAPPQPSSQLPPGFAWILSFGASALTFAFYLIYVKMFAAGGQPAANYNGWFSCCATVTCCNTVVTNNSVQGPNEERV